MNLLQIVEESRASQSKHELAMLLLLLNGINPKRILEIGVHKGYSCEVWRKAFPDADIWGIEKDPMFLDFKDFNLIEGDSQSREMLGKIAQIGPIDVLFIDGDHTNKGVTADYINYSQFVKPGGIVVFHDTRRTSQEWWGKVDVWKIFQDLQKEYPSVEFWEGEGHPGTGVIFK